MRDNQRHAVAKAAAEAWFRRSVSDEYMLTPCTGSQAFYDIADAVYAILQRFPTTESRGTVEP